MSPKPVDLDRALKTLRAERPSPESAERARTALFRAVPPPVEATPLLATSKERATRRSLARPLAAMLIVTAFAAVALAPRATAGAAWAQTLVNSFDAVPSHSLSLQWNGKKSMEEWRSGRKRAHLLYDRSGSPFMEWRDDGVRNYNYAGRGFTNPDAPNSILWASVSKSFPLGFRDEMPQGSPEALLRQPGVEVVSHEEASSGRPESYRLRVPRPWMRAKKQELVAELDREGRIVRLRYPGYPGGTTIDYPTSLPDAIFEPKSQTIPGVVAIDSRVVFEEVQRDVRQGIATRGPITLRAAILTGDGDLWAFWTGALPDPKLSRPFSTPGVQCGPAFTNKIFTTAWRQSPKMNGVPVETKGPRLGGMGRTPLVKLGRTVDLDIPYPGGVAHFRNVRYRRIGLIQHVSDVLGAKRDYR